MPGKLTQKHYRAIETLLTSANASEAATAAGVSRDTLYRWLKDDTFKQALTGAEGEALAALSRSLVSMGDTATATLRDAMTGSNTPTGAKIRAADIVLARLLQLRELVTLEDRISRLEAANNDNKKPT